jgi:hypothetical protein
VKLPTVSSYPASRSSFAIFSTSSRLGCFVPTRIVELVCDRTHVVWGSSSRLMSSIIAKNHPVGRATADIGMILAAPSSSRISIACNLPFVQSADGRSRRRGAHSRPRNRRRRVSHKKFLPAAGVSALKPPHAAGIPPTRRDLADRSHRPFHSTRPWLHCLAFRKMLRPRFTPKSIVLIQREAHSNKAAIPADRHQIHRYRQFRSRLCRLEETLEVVGQAGQLRRVHGKKSCRLGQ